MNFELRPFFENEIFYEIVSGILYAYHRTNDELLGSTKFPVDIDSKDKTTEEIEKVAERFEFSIEDAVVKMIEKAIYKEGKYNIVIADDTLTFYDYEKEDWVNHKREGIYEWIGIQIEKQIQKEDKEIKEIEADINKEETAGITKNIQPNDTEINKEEPIEKSTGMKKESNTKENTEVEKIPKDSENDKKVDRQKTSKKEKKKTGKDIPEVWINYYESYEKVKNTKKHGKTVEQLVKEAKEVIKNDFGDPKTIETTELMDHMMDQVEGLHNAVLVMYTALYEIYVEK